MTPKLTLDSVLVVLGGLLSGCGREGDRAKAEPVPSSAPSSIPSAESVASAPAESSSAASAITSAAPLPTTKSVLKSRVGAKEVAPAQSAKPLTSAEKPMSCAPGKCSGNKR